MKIDMYSNPIPFEELAANLGIPVDILIEKSKEAGLLDEEGNPTQKAINEGLCVSGRTYTDVTGKDMTVEGPFENFISFKFSWNDEVINLTKEHARDLANFLFFLTGGLPYES